MYNNNVKKFLFVVPNDSLGGAEQLLKMLARYFSLESSQIEVFFLKNKQTNSWGDLGDLNNVTLNYSRASNEKLGLFFLFFKLLFKRYHYSFTSHVSITGFIGFLKKLGFLKINFFIGRESTTIFNRFSGLKLKFYKIMYFLGYSELDLLICQTGFMKCDFEKHLPRIAKKIKVETIYNPIDFTIVLEKQKAVLPQVDFPFIVSAGRLIPEKGFDVLIKSFKEIKKEYKELKLIVLGEGKLRVFLENLIEEEQLQGSVVLEGFVDNVYPYFKAAELCVVSSRVEGFPNVLLQMMSQNTKVVSTLCAGGISEIKGVNTVKVNDSLKLAIKIKQTLNQDTSSNRFVFDEQLNNRSLDSFIERIENLLNE